jgi:hypothetical protein
VSQSPRIQKVAAVGPTALNIQWEGGSTDLVDLAGWIASDILAPLRNPMILAKPFVDDHGAAVAWDDGDLHIDAAHLEKFIGRQ